MWVSLNWLRMAQQVAIRRLHRPRGAFTRVASCGPWYPSLYPAY